MPISLDEANKLLQGSGGATQEKRGALPGTLSLEQAQAVMKQDAQQEEKGFFGRTADAIAAAYKGNATRDLPEFEDAVGADMKITDIPGIGDITLMKSPEDAYKLNDGQLKSLLTGFMAEPTNEGRVGIIKQAIPDAKFGADENGNPIVTLPNGKQAYINRSGFSFQDVKDLLGEVAKFLPASRTASLATKGMAPFSKIAGQMVAAGGTQLAADQVAQAEGSTRPTSLEDAGVVAAIAGVTEGLAPFAIGLLRKIMGGKSLTTAETKQLTAAGLKPEEITPERAAAIVQSRVADPATRQRIAAAQSLPEPVPLSTGQATQNPRTLQMEAELPKTSDRAAAISQEFKDRQNAAIQKNIDTLRRQFSGSDLPKSPAEIGADIQQKLVSMRQAQSREVTAAYEGAAQGRAFVPSNALNDLNTGLKKQLNDMRFDVEGNPAVSRFFTRMDELRNGFAMADGATGAAVKARNPSAYRVQTLEDMRKYVNANIIQTAGDNAAQRAAGLRMVKEIDRQVDDFVAGGLLSGDPKAIDAIREARKASASFKQRFESDDIVERLTTKEGIGGNARLSVDADDAINAIFGKAGITRQGIGNDVMKLKQTLPPEDFSRLKEAAFLRLLRNDQGEGAFSAKRFSDGLNDAANKYPNMMKGLFSPEEMRAMRRFGEVARLAQENPNRNFSNSSSAIINAMSRFFGRPGDFAGGMLQKITGAGNQAVKEEGLRRSLNDGLPVSRRGLLPNSVGGVGAGLSSETQNLNIPKKGYDVPASPGAPDKPDYNGVPSDAPLKDEPRGDLKGKGVQLQPQTYGRAIGAINHASKASGEDFGVLYKIARAESAFNASAKARTSSASGLFQITNGTWRDLVSKYGEQAGVTLKDKDDPAANALMAGFLTRENRSWLRDELGREPSDGELYAAHFLGPDSAGKLIVNRNSGASAARAFPKAAQANKSIFYNSEGRARTVSEVYQIITNKVA